MSEPTVDRAREAVDAVYRSDSRRVLATLIRLLGDFDLAEEAGVPRSHRRANRPLRDTPAIKSSTLERKSLRVADVFAL